MRILPDAGCEDPAIAIRAPAPAARDQRIMIRLTAAEHDLLTRRANVAGLSPARSTPGPPNKAGRSAGERTAGDVSGTDPPAGPGEQSFTVTPEHPFWEPTQHTWTLAGALEAGDQLLQRDGDHLTIPAVTTLDRTEPFTVEVQFGEVPRPTGCGSAVISGLGSHFGCAGTGDPACDRRRRSSPSRREQAPLLRHRVRLVEVVALYQGGPTLNSARVRDSAWATVDFPTPDLPPTNSTAGDSAIRRLWHPCACMIHIG
jgi:hypothetical protein